MKTHESKADHGRHCFRHASNLIERQMGNVIRDELKQNLEEAETHLINHILCLSYPLNCLNHRTTSRDMKAKETVLSMRHPSKSIK
jgi:hypothetical protein